MAQIERLEAYYHQDSGNPSLACDYADALMAAGRYADAKTVLVALPPPANDEPRVRLRVARCALVAGELEETAQLLGGLEGSELDGPVLRHDLAFAQLALGKPDAASTTLAPALENPEAPPAVAILHARLLHWQGDYSGGLQTINVALQRAPDSAEAFGVKALILLDQGKLEAANLAAQAALQREKSQPDAAIVAGTLALWSQRLDVADAAFSRVLKTQPRSGRAWLGVGQVKMLRREYAAAHAALERAAAAMPEHIGTWHALAWCQLLSGDVDGAEASYDSALKIDRSFGETHGGLAIVYALRGDAVRAKQRIERARRLDAAGRSAVYAQSLLLLADGHDAEARKLIAPILAQSGMPTLDPLEFLERLRTQMHGKQGQ